MGGIGQEGVSLPRCQGSVVKGGARETARCGSRAGSVFCDGNCGASPRSVPSLQAPRRRGRRRRGRGPGRRGGSWCRDGRRLYGDEHLFGRDHSCRPGCPGSVAAVRGPATPRGGIEVKLSRLFRTSDRRGEGSWARMSVAGSEVRSAHGSLWVRKTTAKVQCDITRPGGRVASYHRLILAKEARA